MKPTSLIPIAYAAVGLLTCAYHLNRLPEKPLPSAPHEMHREYGNACFSAGMKGSLWPLYFAFEAALEVTKP